MKPSLIATLLFATAFAACTGSHKAQDYSVIEDKYCNLTELNYLEVSDTIHRTQNGNIEGGVKANGKAIFSDKISLDSIGANLSAGNKVFIDQRTFRMVKVSREYFENFNKMRAALCNLVGGLKSGILSESEFKSKAAEQYLEINRLFAGLDQQPQKKSS